MELKHCQSTHVIHAIRAGVVVNNQNLDSDGKPALISKTLQDIYKYEDAKTLRRSTFTFQKVKREPVDVCFQADSELVNASDDETTLKELKNRFLTKKRKTESDGSKINKGHGNEKSVEDDLDLDEPIIKWKSRQSKNTKAKKKHINKSVASSFSTASHNPINGSSQQFGGEIVPVICKKVQVGEVKEISCHGTSFATDGLSTGQIEDPSPCSAVSKEGTEISHHECSEMSWSSDERHQCIAATEVPDYHLEDIQPICMLFPWSGLSVDLHCPGIMDSHPLAVEMGNECMASNVCKRSPSDDQYPNVFSDSGRSFTDKVLYEQNSSSGMQVLAIDFPQERDDSVSGAVQKYGSSEDSIMFLKAGDSLVSEEDNTAVKEQALSSILNSPEENTLTSKSWGHVEDELLMSKEKQTSASPITKKEMRPCEKNPTFNKDIFSSSELCQHPGRLLSKRKVIDPSSQERLCKAMHSEDICNEVDQCIIPEYEGKFLQKQIGKKASSMRSGIPMVKININHGLGEQVSQRKVIINPRHTIKKLQNAKGSLDGPRISRSLPKLSTAFTSVQSCSESAIAFSQRQMHDMENLAEKLMNELNSMKEIVEQKLLFESYRNAFVKSDTDEVKSAISSATRVEEAGRKWLNLMSRDCNRFCKIMKLNPQNAGGSKDARRDGKKIKFADEIGGKLCNVRLFEVNEIPSTSDPTEQEEVHSHYPT